MKKAFSLLFSYLTLIMLNTIQLINSFEFKYIQVTFDPPIINQIATYQFSLNRQYTKDFTDTAWRSQAIPAQARLRIAFPSQYQLSDLSAVGCSYVLLDYNPIEGFTCNFNSATKQVQIDGLFPDISNTSYIDVELTNIRNPMPSILTDPFIAYVGNDYSANDPKASIFFSPAELNSFRVTFSNPTVNTTSDMILMLQIKNYFPMGGHVELTFPPTLQWSRDVSSNHLFPIEGILACQGVSANVNSMITCLGMRSTRTVAFTNIVSSNITAGTLITIKLKNMFSPPTTETTNPSDSLLVKTFDQSSAQIEYKNSFVQGLQPKNLSTLQIIPLSTTFIVNTMTSGLNFTFTLEDTTTFDDYFQMIFPSGTTITYRTPSSLYRFDTVNWNATNSTLTWFQSITSIDRQQGSQMYIGFINYRVPRSTRTQNVQFKVMKRGYQKMVGWGKFSGDTNKYNLSSLALNDTKINAASQLTISFQLRDPLFNTGQIVILLPQRLYITQAQLTVSATSSISTTARINPTPSIKYYSQSSVISSASGSTSYTCSGPGGCLIINLLNTVSTIELNTQNITLKIGGVKNVEYVTNIDLIGIRTFYDAEWDARVAEISQDTTKPLLRTSSGTLTLSSVSFDPLALNFQQSKLTISLTNQNPIPLTGYINLNIPSDLFIDLSLDPQMKILTSVYMNTSTVMSDQLLLVTVGTNSTFLLKLDLTSINLGSLGPVTEISFTTNVTFEITVITSASKAPLSSSLFTASSFTSSNQLIDQTFTSSSFIYRTMNENSFTLTQLYRSSLTSSNISALNSLATIDDCQQNGKVCGSYIVKLQQQQPFSAYGANATDKNVIEVKMPKYVDVGAVGKVAMAVEKQIVFYDRTSFRMYTNSNPTNAVWVQCPFSIVTSDATMNSILITLPSYQYLSQINILSLITYNRLSLPLSLTLSSLSTSLYLTIQSPRNRYSLSPFTLTYQTQQFIQNLNTYTYSSATSPIYTNTELMSLTLQSYDFTNKYYNAQASLMVNAKMNNWNQMAQKNQLRMITKNNVRYLIVVMGNAFIFANVSTVGNCYLQFAGYRESNVCSIEEVSPDFSWTKKLNSTASPDIASMLADSKYLVVFTISDTMSFAITQSTNSSNNLLSLSLGPFTNPSPAYQSLTPSLKSVSLFTLSQSEYLMHKSLQQVRFQTNCLAPCKECIFLTLNSSEVSSKCKTCAVGMLLYNNTCLSACPQKTFQTQVVNVDNVTVDGCVDCMVSCQSCSSNNSCSSCNSSGTFKYKFINTTTSLMDCLNKCPIQGYFQDSTSTVDPITLNTSTSYQCSTCKTDCSLCLSNNDCYKCSGFLILSSNTCVSSCPSFTVNITKDIVFKNTTIPNVSACIECSVQYNDSNCQYCDTVACVACKVGYFLDYLATKKCLQECTAGYYKVTKVLVAESYNFGVCEKCNQECGTCDVLPGNCTSCKWVANDTSQQYYLLGNICYKYGQCPNGFFSDMTNKICSNCTLALVGCLTCLSINNCTQCNTTADYYLFTNETTSLSKCLTPTQIPKGYLLINGTIQKCAQFCTDCSVSTTNCTQCITGYYLFNLATGVGQCVDQCPSQYYPANAKLCTSCPQPCFTCAVDLTVSNNSQPYCQSCSLNSSLFFYQNQCISPQNCPNTTYPYTDPITGYKTCSVCINNCFQCQDDGQTCIDCKSGFFYFQQKCLPKQNCPQGTIPFTNPTTNLGQCINCQGNCKTCVNSTVTCTSCLSSYYFYRQANKCLSSCPLPLIQDTTTYECVSCQNPCSTCFSTVTNCTSCVQGYFLYSNQCLLAQQCPVGYFANSTSLSCQQCPSGCYNCTSSSNQMVCYLCIDPKKLYDGKCVDTCPQEKKYDVNGVCLNCSEAIQGCMMCALQVNSVDETFTGEQQAETSTFTSQISPSSSVSTSTLTPQCTACFYPFITFNHTCILSCPPSYIYQPSTHQCLTPQQNADGILSKSLSTPTIMPVPFTIVCGVIVIACILSKLQNQNSYFVGTVYALTGVVETLSVAYLILRVVTREQLKVIWLEDYDMKVLLFMICLALIYLINIIAAIAQPLILKNDLKFSKYSQKHCFAYTMVSIISALTSYKFKLVIATKLFNFSIFRSQLQSIQKFNIFNVFSFLGVAHQGLLIYIIVVILLRSAQALGQELTMTMVDVAIVAGVNVVWAFAVVKKDEDFFVEKYEGIVVNKKFDAGSQEETHDFNKNTDSSKFSMTPNIPGDKKNGLMSHDNLMQEISQDDQFSLSISRDQQASQKRSTKSNNVFNQNSSTNSQKNKRKNSSQEDEAMKSSTHLKIRTSNDNLKDSQKTAKKQSLPVRYQQQNQKALKTLENLKNLEKLQESAQKMNQSEMITANKAFMKETGKDMDNLQQEADLLGKKNKSAFPAFSLQEKLGDKKKSPLEAQRSEEKLHILQEENQQPVQDFIVEDQNEENLDKAKPFQFDKMDQTEEKQLPEGQNGQFYPGNSKGWQIQENNFDQDNLDFYQNQDKLFFEQQDSQQPNADETNKNREEYVQQIQKPSQNQKLQQVDKLQDKNNGDEKKEEQHENNDDDLLMMDENQGVENNERLNLQKSRLSAAKNNGTGDINDITKTQIINVTSRQMQKSLEQKQFDQFKQESSKNNLSGKQESIKSPIISMKKSPTIQKQELKQSENLQGQIQAKNKSQQQQSSNSPSKLSQQQSSPQLQVPSSIKATHRANNFFNQPLMQETEMKYSSVLLQEKQRQLQMLKKSRKDLQSENLKLKKRSRSRSKSISKIDKDKSTKNENFRNQKNRKAAGRLYSSKDFQNTLAQNQNTQIQKTEKAEHNINLSKAQQTKQEDSQQLLTTNRMTARQILNLSSTPSKQQKLPQNNQQKQPQQEIILFYQSPKKQVTGEKQKIESNEDLTEQNKKKINQITTQRYERSRSRKRIGEDDDFNSNQKDHQKTKTNFYINVNQPDEDNQVLRSSRQRKSNSNLQVQSNSQGKQQQNSRRIDLGKFKYDNESNQHDEEQTYRINTNQSNSRSRRRIIDSSSNQPITNLPIQTFTQPLPKTVSHTPNLPITVPNPSISSVDRISPTKLRPPTSVQKNPRSQKGIPPTDKSFLSGKSNLSHNQLIHKSNKEISDKDDSQVEVSFYGYNAEGMIGNNDGSFDQYDSAFRSKQLSAKRSSYNPNQTSFSNQLYEYDSGNVGNLQPQKPITTSNSRISSERKITEHDQLSRLITKNARLSRQKPPMKRQSLDKASLPIQYRSTNQPKQRNQSAKKRQSIDKGSRIIQNQTSQINQQEQEDALDQYYNRGRGQRQKTRESAKNENMSRSRSKSRERPMSKQSQNKLKALEKIYLQKLQWKK